MSTTSPTMSTTSPTMSTTSPTMSTTSPPMSTTSPSMSTTSPSPPLPSEKPPPTITVSQVLARTFCSCFWSIEELDVTQAADIQGVHPADLVQDEI
ncbi:PREDICTED: mucin-2-like isoform X1 [Camelina sativa]|uniref:Mucin-2-like isoform X1 n=1 Tax=Camelina sativa TaxID=90675 RepID=A0ABM0WY35_CAMSA|nr:PREDICTED: mucin-2-like isoform X1 [Camelina sativa]